MANKMLIDATHPEETRVVVTRGQRVEEFDFESASRKQLRGNIYLAKVTRVEPSLQAAFVEYGGNRHGFLAFSEIHPDYYQIPVADRQALLEDEAHARREEEDEDNQKRGRRRSRKSAPDAVVSADAESSGDGHEAGHENGGHEGGGHENGGHDHDHGHEDEVIEHVGGDALEEAVERRRPPRRQYKIQEVIKRRQILLVQVVKEERGNKGAALTTYLSIAGRYSVLMPNTGRGGGISRKITSAEDRKRLKEIAHELEVPEGMGVILRTAGASRTKPEIKRDFEYLMRVWENVRELTLNSIAPALVHEEGSLIKRSIRDLYNKDIDEVLVAGDDAYREAKDFMRMLMPSHAKAVKLYKDPQPLFAKHGIEAQLDAMFSNQVTLKSGGYIVINPTEALVSIDVNSGRSTREHNIEDTALKTNLEAAEEISRQLRLRDLAGLIVIDFIDMEEHRNNRAVEKKLKDCLKNDRARIQVGRISGFGLMEMSRQRMRTGVLESSSIPCPHCGGSGSVRATPSVALQILRSIEEALIKSASHNLIVRTRTDVALYVLNQKRSHLAALEDRFGVTVTIRGDDTLGSPSIFAVEKGEPSTGEPRITRVTATAVDAADEIEDAAAEAEDEIEAEAETDGPAPRRDARPEGERGDDAGGRRRRRRRRRRGRGGEREGQEHRAEDGSREDNGDHAGSDAEADGEGGEDRPEAAAGENGNGEDGRGRRRRRGRRGGRRGRRENGEGFEAGAAEGGEAALTAEAGDDAVITAAQAEPEPAPEPVAEEKPRRGGRRRKAEAAEAETAPEVPSEPAAKPARSRAAKAAKAEAPAEAEAEAPAKPARRTRAKAKAEVEAIVAGAAAEPPAAEPAAAAIEPEPRKPAREPQAVVLTAPEEDPNRPKRSGWWAKAKSALSGGD